jgi:arginine-tRNA-protein transferase
MSHINDPILNTVQFYATATYPCSYLPDHQARSQVAAPTHVIDNAVYSRLIEQGFRRSGLFTYRPHCDHCQACTPIRVDALNFTPNRAQKRAWRYHAPRLHTQNAPLRLNPEHFELYRRYIRARHPGAGMDDDDETQYSQFLLTSRVNTNLIEFRDNAGVLRMVSIIDVLNRGLSAVYTFFDPQAAGSLGVFGILWQLDRCRAMGLPWLYLGYRVEQSRKMAYKSQYTPHQVLRDGVWAAP